MPRYRYQIRFTKTGLLRWISHRDLARLWERMARRVGLRLAMSEGFSPKARISFPSALALGTESHDEVVELDLTEPLDAEQVLRRLAEDAVDGLRILQVCQLPDGYGRAQLDEGHFVLEMPEDTELDAEDTGRRIERLVESGTLQITRKGKSITADVRQQIADLAVRDGRLEMRLRSSRTASLRPQDVLEALGLEWTIEAGGRLLRVRTQLDRQVDPSHCVTVDQLNAEGALHSNTQSQMRNDQR